MSETVDRVKAVNIYPIKSGHAATVDGIYPSTLGVGMTGFEAHGVADREFLLYDPAEGAIVTQRGWAKDSQKPKFKNDAVLATARINILPDHMAVSVAGFGQVEIPTEYEDNASQKIEVFGNELHVLEQRGEAAEFFTRLLDRDIRLVRADHSQSREMPAPYMRPGAANKVAGADGMPFLLVSQASLDWQHKKNGYEPGDVPIDRYRGNIVIGGYAIGAFTEDRIKQIKFGDMAAEIVKACARCPIPNINQETGSRGGSGGLAVLRGRAGTAADGITQGVFFGQNLNHFWTPGLTVSAGDPVTVLSIADRPNLTLRAA